MYATCPPKSALRFVVLLPKFEPTNPVTIQWLSVIPYSLAGVTGGTVAGGGLGGLCAATVPGSAASDAAITNADNRMRLVFLPNRAARADPDA
jgi:hypothetical protein